MLPKIDQKAQKVPGVSKLSTPYDQVNTTPENRAFPLDEAIGWLEINGKTGLSDKLSVCGETHVHSECDNGHSRFTSVVCRKEICPICGKKGSLAHRRNWRRCCDRLLWSEKLTQTVFTLPSEISNSHPDREKLSKLSKIAAKVAMNNLETDGGMVRPHILGDKGAKLHIHYNVLMPLRPSASSAQVPQATLKAMKQEWTAEVNALFETTYDEMVVHYSFADAEGKKIHMIKYVTRPIVTTEKFNQMSDQDKHYYLSLKGLHQIRWYGNLANAHYKKTLRGLGKDPDETTQKDPAFRCNCLVCGEKYRFQGVVLTSELPRMQLRFLDRGVQVDLETYAFLAREREKKS